MRLVTHRKSYDRTRAILIFVGQMAMRVIEKRVKGNNSSVTSLGPVHHFPLEFMYLFPIYPRVHIAVAFPSNPYPACRLFRNRTVLPSALRCFHDSAWLALYQDEETGRRRGRRASSTHTDWAVPSSRHLTGDPRACLTDGSIKSVACCLRIDR